MLNPAMATTIEPSGSAGDVIPFPLYTLRSKSSSSDSAEAALESALNAPSVRILPSNRAKRQAAAWRGLGGEVVQVSADEPFELAFQGPSHLLIAYKRATRRDGETIVEGLPQSTLRDFGQKLTFVPAGCSFKERQNPAVPTRATFLFIDPAGPLLDEEVGFNQATFMPRLFFENPILSHTARKLETLIEAGGTSSRLYAEALGVVLAHELMRLETTAAQTDRPARGGLAGWQRKRVFDYIDDNLSDQISLRALAGLVQLSPYHFSRAFKQAFGLPPHRYHAQRRIERAKALLADPRQPITEIALGLGFAEASSFTRVFHKFTGRTPRDYRRSIV